MSTHGANIHFRVRWEIYSRAGGRDGTRGNKDARGENHLCQLWISCLRAEARDVSSLGRRRTRWAARGGGGRRAPREEVAVAFRAKQQIVLVIHPADGVGAPRRARAQLGLGEARAQRRRLRLLLGRLRLRLHLGRFALGGSGRQGLRCRGRAGGLAARQMLSTHASSTSVDGVDDDAEPSDEVRAAGAGAEGLGAWILLIRRGRPRCERRTGFLTTGAPAAAGTLSEGEVFSAVDVLMGTSEVHTVVLMSAVAEVSASKSPPRPQLRFWRACVKSARNSLWLRGRAPVRRALLSF